MKTNIDSKKQATAGSSNGKRNFLAAANQVINVVASFGEAFCAKLFGGEIVSTDEEFSAVADVIVERSKVAVQVKMCNRKHAHRPTVGQISTLFNEVEDDVKFVRDIRVGVYALVFYDGVHRSEKIGVRKSKLLTRTLSRDAKGDVLAEEIEYVHVLDVALMHHLATASGFEKLRKSGNVKVCAERKLGWNFDNAVLYLTRTFLNGFMEKELDKVHQSALEGAFGQSKWRIEEHHVPFVFKGVGGKRLRKSIIVRVIGHKNTNKTVRGILERKKKKEFDIRSIYAPLVVA